MNPMDDPKPGFQWPVTVVQRIPAPADTVWDVISMPGNLELCHPYCAQNPVDVWPGENSRDEVHYLSGWVFERQFCRWIDGVGYDLDIGRSGGGKSFVSWRIVPLDDQNSSLGITVYPHILQNQPPGLRWLPHFLYVGPHLRNYLSSVARGFAWYITRGESVPRNQFGRHPWFSDSRAGSLVIS